MLELAAVPLNWSIPSSSHVGQQSQPQQLKQSKSGQQKQGSKQQGSKAQGSKQQGSQLKSSKGHFKEADPSEREV